MHETYHDRVQEVERLAHELNSLLTTNPSFLRQRKMHRQARGLIHWADAYRDGLRYGSIAGEKTPADGNAWMTGVSDRFKLETEMKVNSKTMAREEKDKGTAETEEFIRSAEAIIANAKTADLAHHPNPSERLSSLGQKESAMLQTRVKDLMQENPVIISPAYSLQDAAQEMGMINCGMLLVGTDDKIEGLITDRDIVLRAVAKGKDVCKEKVRDYMTSDLYIINEDDETYRAADMMREKKVNRLLVNDAQGHPKGVLTFGRIMRQNDSMHELALIIECAVGPKGS